MAVIKISSAVADSIYATRKIANIRERKAAKGVIFRQIKSDNGIPSSTKIKINILNADKDNYLAVQNKRTGIPLTNSLPDPVIAVVAGASAAADTRPVIATKAEAVKKAPASTAKKPTVKVKKALPVAAPVKKVVAAKKPVAKPVVAAKKVVAKPAAKAAAPAKAAKPAAKAAPVKAVASAAVKKLGSPTKTAKHLHEVRAVVNGVRTRLGWASSEKEKAAMIAAARA